MRNSLTKAIFALALVLGLIFFIGAACPTGVEEDEDEDDQEPVERGPRLIDNSDGTVSDLDQGLMWQTSGSSEQQAWWVANEYCGTLNSVGYAGYSDWRLPDITQLRTLVDGCETTGESGTCGVDADCLDRDACFNADCYGCRQYEGPSGCYWNELFVGQDCGMYWSSSIEQGSERAWGLDFSNASLVDEQGTLPANTRCVRPQYAPLIDNGDGTASDPVSKLTWQNTPSKFAWDYDDALIYCQELTLAEHKDWRLPQIDELRSLVRGCPQTERGGRCDVTPECLLNACYDDNCKGCTDDEGPRYDALLTNREYAPNHNYISATFHPSEGRADDQCAWYVDFNYGRVACLYNNAQAEVRCVRDR
ncbi:MAG: DUF1566 domain-containing protein [Candidatus Alcyoniella australis]|nr:DUF1566 domain-containing protein [Candidatus Alcyoniella australis]